MTHTTTAVDFQQHEAQVRGIVPVDPKAPTAWVVYDNDPNQPHRVAAWMDAIAPGGVRVFVPMFAVEWDEREALGSARGAYQMGTSNYRITTNGEQVKWLRSSKAQG
ncbi:hypothetical protein [Rhodococcus sp. 114MFTsu3.1]|uniref:hypothetical protein n=1 Tax=Rhodococcus sp. 114MFTsu3.1 TaxID=1172184 RepID=UPI0003637B3F|nr:hypothetical protein [Rhodococcus sp. 114MFTsu3.1]